METYTHREILELTGFAFFQLRLFLVTCFSAMCAGAIILTLPVLTAWIQCEFKVSAAITTLMSTSMFIARIIGAMIKGTLSDYYGRIKTFQLYLALTSWSCLVFAVSPSLFWILICRSAMGFSAGGLFCGFMVEYFPPNYTKLVALNRDSYNVGCMLLMVFIYFTVDYIHWRTVFILVGIMSMLACALGATIPDPPRYLMLHGKIEMATKALRSMTKSADIARPVKVVMPETNNGKNELPISSLLFSKRFMKTTLLLILIRFSNGLFTTGTAILSITYIGKLHTSRFTVTNVKCSQCSQLTMEYYKDQILLSYFGIIGGLLGFSLVDIIGRLKVMRWMLVANVVTFLSLNLWTNPLNVRVMLFLAKMSSAGFGNCTIVYISELYPTYARERTSSLSHIIFIFGEMASVPISELIVTWDERIAAFIYLAFSVGSLLACLLLPVETNGKELEDL